MFSKEELNVRLQKKLNGPYGPRVNMDPALWIQRNVECAFDLIMEVLVEVGAEKEEITGLPVKGYKPTQSKEAIALANTGKEIEERILRYIEQVEAFAKSNGGDPRFAAIGRTQIQLGFMAVVRAIFNPGRINLPEDF